MAIPKATDVKLSTHFTKIVDITDLTDNRSMLLNVIKQMERACRGDDSIVSLAQGIPFQHSSPSIRETAIAAIVTGKADQYSDPQGLHKLRESIAHTLAEQDMHYTADEIIVTAGAIEALNVALHTFITPQKNEVVMPVPVYSAYGRVVNVAGGKVVPVQLDEAMGWELNVQDIEQAITARTAAILLCNPNNPTGTVYDKQALMRLTELAAQRGIILIVDEVYGNMLYDDSVWFSPAQLSKYRKHVMRIVSFSKDFALTGWRVGYLHTDSSHIDELVAVHDSLVNCAPVVSQYAALAALRESGKIVQANATTYERHRRIMASYLEQLGPKVSYIMPQGAYFFFVKINSVKDITAFCMKLLENYKVAVVPGADFGAGGEGYVRLCFGRSASSIHTAMQRFVTCVEETHGK